MKTLELELKKKVLIVDAINEKIAYGIIFQKLGAKTVSDYKFLCKGSELTEEIASELVNSDNDYGVIMYQNYRTTSMCYFDEQINALESFISAVESKGFHWLENPIKHPKDYEVFPDSLSLYAEQEKLHLEAEEKLLRVL